MKLIPVFFVITLASAFATTRVQEVSVVDPGGHKVQSGSAKICPTASFSSGPSIVLLKSCATFAITAGVFTADLVPTNTITSQGQYYQVSWTTAGGTWQEVWLVPATSAVLRIAAVRVTTTVLAPSTILNATTQLNWAPLADGCLALVGGILVTLPLPCGGSSGALHWTGLTSSQWAALTSAQWAALGN